MTSQSQENTPRIEEVEEGLEALDATFRVLEGHDAQALTGVLDPEQLKAIADLAESMNGVADKLDGVATELEQFSGSRETISSLTRKFNPFIRNLIDDPTNHKVLTAVTGAGAAVPHILKGPAGASRMFLNSLFPYHYGESDRLIRGRGFEDGAVTKKAALALVSAAYYDAQQSVLEHGREGVDDSPNVIAASATSGIATNRTRGGRDHIWGAVRTLASTSTYYVEFEKGEGQDDREWQDALCNIIATNSILAAAELPQLPITDERAHSEQLVPNPDGPGRILQLEEVKIDPAMFDGPGPFLVYRDGTFATQEEIAEILKRDIVIFPGSFDLVHYGHEEAAHSAFRKTRRDVFFEISADNANADKPPIDNETIARRVVQNLGRHPTFVTRGVPFFTQKLDLFTGAKDYVVGWDIAQKIASPSSYPDGEQGMIAALQKLKSSNTLIQVLGRWDDEAQRMKSARDIMCPIDYAGVFSSLTGQADVDSYAKISSSRLREILAEKSS